MKKNIGHHCNRLSSSDDSVRFRLRKSIREFEFGGNEAGKERRKKRPLIILRSRLKS